MNSDETCFLVWAWQQNATTASRLRGLWPTRAPTDSYRPVLRASPSRTGQFQHVVDTTGYTPLPRDLRQAPQQELSEATRLFDLAKYRFDHLFSQTIATAIPGAFQADLHCVDSRPRDGRACASG